MLAGGTLSVLEGHWRPAGCGVPLAGVERRAGFEPAVCDYGLCRPVPSSSRPPTPVSLATAERLGSAVVVSYVNTTLITQPRVWRVKCLQFPQPSHQLSVLECAAV